MKLEKNKKKSEKKIQQNNRKKIINWIEDKIQNEFIYDNDFNLLNVGF